MELQQYVNQSISSTEILNKYQITPWKLLEEYEQFCSYWKEKSPNGRKERWEKEKTFDPNLRFHRWLRNYKKWNHEKKEFKQDNIIITNEF